MTIGLEGPSLKPGALGSVGIDFDAWTEDSPPLENDDGAVFFMDPDHGATAEPVVFMQLTVRAGSGFSGQLSAQGRSANGGKDWQLVGEAFDQNGAVVPGARPPPRGGSALDPSDSMAAEGREPCTEHELETVLMMLAEEGSHCNSVELGSAVAADCQQEALSQVSPQCRACLDDGSAEERAGELKLDCFTMTCKESDVEVFEEIGEDW